MGLELTALRSSAPASARASRAARLPRARDRGHSPAARGHARPVGPAWRLGSQTVRPAGAADTGAGRKEGASPGTKTTAKQGRAPRDRVAPAVRVGGGGRRTHPQRGSVPRALRLLSRERHPLQTWGGHGVLGWSLTRVHVQTGTAVASRNRPWPLTVLITPRSGPAGHRAAPMPGAQARSSVGWTAGTSEGHPKIVN